MWYSVFKIEKTFILFSVYGGLVKTLTARQDERYAGQGIKVSGFDGVPIPAEFVDAEKHKLLPIFVVSDHVIEVSMALRFLSNLTKVRSD